MKTEKFSLSALVARVMGKAEDPAKETGAETKTADEKSDADDKVDTDPEPGADDTKTDETETKTAETETKTTETETKSASIPATVSMSMEDFNGLTALADEAETLRADNTKLKAKADQWDSYQAAVSGSHKNADTSGAKADGGDGNEKTDEYSDLRKKHGALMDGI